MEWPFGLALLPVLLCGLMCVGGMVLAAVGLRRKAAPPKRSDEPTDTGLTVRRQEPARR